jgi:hypothetical protein
MTAQMDFGPICVASEAEYVAQLKNAGDCPAVFWLSAPPAGVKVSPERGRVLAGDSLDLVVTLRALQPAIYDEKTCAITLNLRGAKPLVIPFSAQAVLPEVTIVEPECVVHQTVSFFLCHRVERVCCVWLFLPLAVAGLILEV